jgi:hypothetical protein
MDAFAVKDRRSTKEKLRVGKHGFNGSGAPGASDARQIRKPKPQKPKSCEMRTQLRSSTTPAPGCA